MTTKKKVDWRVLCIGLICLTGLEIYALSRGVNGVMLGAVIAIIAGVVGWNAPQLNTR